MGWTRNPRPRSKSRDTGTLRIKGEFLRIHADMCRGDSKLLIAIVLTAALFACGPSKPSGSEYLGKWDGATVDDPVLGTTKCPVVISRNGESFLVKVEDAHCSAYQGIYTLTPEGNLKGGPMGTVVMSLDKSQNQIVLSAGGGLAYLRREAQPHTEKSQIGERLVVPPSVLPTAHRVETPKVTLSEQDAILSRLIGKWDGYTIYYDAQERQNKRGAEQHCEFVRDNKGVKFIGENGQVLSEDNAYLTFQKGKLYGSYLAGKHGGTHGKTWTQRFRIDLRDDNTLVFEDSTWKIEYEKRR